MKPENRAIKCPNQEHHKTGPVNIVDWHVWAEEMERTHTQSICSGCDLYLMWTLTASEIDLAE